jgi:hypothetical protein
MQHRNKHHRSHTTHTYAPGGYTSQLDGFETSAVCTRASYVTWLRVITMHILATYFVTRNARHLAVNEHTSTCQYGIILTKHEQQNAGEITENYYLSANTNFNIILSSKW